MSKCFFGRKLDWEKFDEFAAHHQAWPTWKKWASIVGLSICIFGAPAAFYHNGIISISRLGVIQSIVLTEHPTTFFVVTAIVEVVLIFSLVVWVIVLFLYEPFKADR